MYNRVIVVLCAIVLSPWLWRDDNRDAYGFISATVDSLKALGSMQLTREDSVLVHLSDAQDRERWDILDDSMTIDLSPTSRKYSLRYVVAGNGEYGSYVILHRGSREDKTVRRLSRDSCDAFGSTSSMSEPAVRIVDFNHDGYKDIIVSFSVNTVGYRGMNCFLAYDTAKRDFVADSLMDEMFQDLNIGFNEDAEVVESGAISGCCSSSSSEYWWTGKTYILCVEASTGLDSVGNSVHIRKQLVEGQWRVVECDTTKD
jgi:hypothetical protein